MCKALFRRLIASLLCISAAGLVSAGEVQVELSQGVVYVLGSVKSDRIRIEHAFNRLQIHALDSNTTVGRGESASFAFDLRSRLVVDLGAGEDTCDVENLSCASIGIVDGPVSDQCRDDIKLENVHASKGIGIDCGMGDDVVIVSSVTAGTVLNIGTGSENDVAVIYDVGAPMISLLMGDGNDFAMVGEIDSLIALFDGGRDTWTKRDAFDRLSGDVMVHMDYFEVSTFDVLGSSVQFENELSFLNDVKDTPLEGLLEAMAASLGYY